MVKVMLVKIEDSPRKEMMKFSPPVRHSFFETKNACEFVKQVMNTIHSGFFLKYFLQCVSLLSKFSFSFTITFQLLCIMKYIL